MATALISDEILRCANCPFETKSVIGLSRHVKQKHGLILSTAKNTCSFCKKVFSSSASCTRHIATKVCIPIQEVAGEAGEIKEIKIINAIEEPITILTPEKEQKDTKSHPIHMEESNFTKNSIPFLSTFVKIMVCSVFFIPFYQRITKK